MTFSFFPVRLRKNTMHHLLYINNSPSLGRTWTKGMNCRLAIYVKDWELQKETKVNSEFLLIKCSKKCFILLPTFYLIICLMIHESTCKEFWKNSRFENMTAGFLHRCQNRLRRNTPEIIHFQTWQKMIFTNIAPWQLLFSLNVVCNVSKWYSDHFWGPWHTQKSIFASMNQYFNDKLSLFLTKGGFDTSEEN